MRVTFVGNVGSVALTRYAGFARDGSVREFQSETNEHDDAGGGGGGGGCVVSGGVVPQPEIRARSILSSFVYARLTYPTEFLRSTYRLMESSGVRTSPQCVESHTIAASPKL